MLTTLSFDLNNPEEKLRHDHAIDGWRWKRLADNLCKMLLEDMTTEAGKQCMQKRIDKEKSIIGLTQNDQTTRRELRSCPDP